MKNIIEKLPMGESLVVRDTTIYAETEYGFTKKVDSLSNEDRKEILQYANNGPNKYTEIYLFSIFLWQHNYYF